MMTDAALKLSTFPWAPGVEEYILPNATYKDLQAAVHARRDFHNVFVMDTDWDDIRERQLDKLIKAHWNFEYHLPRYQRFFDSREARVCFQLTHAEMDILYPDMNRWNQSMALQRADARFGFCYYQANITTFTVVAKKLAMYECLGPLVKSDPSFWEDEVYGDDRWWSRIHNIPWKPSVEQEEFKFLDWETLDMIANRYLKFDTSYMKGPKLRAYRRQLLLLKIRVRELRGLPADSMMATALKNLESV